MNIFLKISNLFKKFKTNDADKAYNKYYINTELGYSIFVAIHQRNLNDFLSIPEKIPNDKSKFYRKSFDMVVSEDNEEIFKHLFDNNHLTLNDINPDNLLHTLSNENAYKIALVLLYDLNFQVTEKMKRILTCDKDGKNHTKMLALIEKRDLFLELDENLNSDQTKEKSRINKI